MYNRIGSLLPIAVFCLLSMQALAGEDSRAARIAGFNEKREQAAKGKNHALWIQAADFCLKNQLWEFYSETLNQAIAADPANAEAQKRLGRKRVGTEWLSDEDVFLREAKQKSEKGLGYYANNWGTAAQIEALRIEDRKKIGWSCDYRLNSPLGYVTIYSNESLENTRRAAAITEAAGYAYWEFYKTIFKLRPPPPLVVYLFKDRASFNSNYSRVNKVPAPPEGVVGVYTPSTKILFVHSDTGSEGDSYVSTMAHEMIHAMDDRLAGVLKGNTPNWLTEGRAEHIGTYACCGEVVIPGYVGLDPSTAAVPFLKREIENTKLRDFLQQSEDAKFGFDGYCLSFAFIHFLFHAEKEKYAPGFKLYLAAGPTKYGLAEFEKTVGKVEVLEPAFKKYVNDFLLPGMSASQKAARRNSKQD